jgi:CRP-like cAMP-binding protein
MYLRRSRSEHELTTLRASERYLALLARVPDIEQRVAQYHIASYLGMTPVTLSRTRRNLGMTRSLRSTNPRCSPKQSKNE